jgi:hypothetical protein
MIIFTKTRSLLLPSEVAKRNAMQLLFGKLPKHPNDSKVATSVSSWRSSPKSSKNLVIKLR